MYINGKQYNSIWWQGDGLVQIIDQRNLPHEFVVEDLRKVDDAVTAIKDMHVRGAGLIGATAGYGMYLASLEAPKDKEGFDEFMSEAGERLKATRPTAVNLSRAVDMILERSNSFEGVEEKTENIHSLASDIAYQDQLYCRKIGEQGVKIIEDICKRKNGDNVNILTHCNAGWLAFVNYGSATSPIYHAHERKIPIHVWVDETRPRNQGARITAWELGKQGVDHTVIADNVGGHLMQQGKVDLVITGADRVARNGDVANKIGTYLKALAAKDNNVPFYVALPSTTMDWNIMSGDDIPIEQRGEDEVKYIQGLHEGELKSVLLTPEDSPAANYGFDITPNRFVTGLITEKGIYNADGEGINKMISELDYDIH